MVARILLQHLIRQAFACHLLPLEKAFALRYPQEKAFALRYRDGAKKMPSQKGKTLNIYIIFAQKEKEASPSLGLLLKASIGCSMPLL